MQPHPIRILGIDPGLRRTGWGAIAVSGNAVSFLGAGTVSSNASDSLAERLASLYAGLETVLGEIGPAEVAVEKTFVNRDAAATLKLGQARGIALLAPARIGLPVSEYAPNLVKKTVIGVGHGDKKQIRMMVNVLLPKATFDSDDAADALAIALCHAQHRQARVLADRLAESA
ncbi:crossover junction endodeoxyribonuclease RuvC [Amorphus coralli]|uniref:crossover junction endodeoxyribonuclease RuvC n=1 Tax=Amorphus coralli TaxID=340680 RepID=UPI00037F0DE7|nr:crossover junction endodeoxyribonuclease RuvC [Amorphus coralli]